MQEKLDEAMQKLDHATEFLQQEYNNKKAAELQIQVL